MQGVAVAFLLAFVSLASLNSGKASGAAECPPACWVETAPPTYVQLEAYSSFNIPYVNLFSSASIGIVFMVVHNYLGQTVEISTATLQLAAGANGTAYPIAFGLASGTYSATFFVTEASGVAIASTSTASFAV